MRSNLTASVLQSVSGSGSIGAQISKALDLNLFTFAAIISLKAPPGDVSFKEQHKTIRGLTYYDPRLLPVNLNALHKLQKHWSIEIESIDKTRLLYSLLEYNDPSLVKSGFSLLSNKSAGPPLSINALMALVTFCRHTNDAEFATLVWDYIRSNFPLLVKGYGIILFDLMFIFASTKRFSKALEVANSIDSNDQYAQIAVELTKNKLQGKKRSKPISENQTGIQMNLKIKQSVKSEHFNRAKRHYLNAHAKAPYKQRMIALVQLMNMKDCDRVWLNEEMKRLQKTRVDDPRNAKLSEYIADHLKRPCDDE